MISFIFKFKIPSHLLTIVVISGFEAIFLSIKNNSESITSSLVLIL